MSHLVSHACPSQCKALTICHVNRHLSGSPESRLTCETRLPGSPGLACGAARPCKHSQCLTLCHMPAIFNAKLWHPAMSIDISVDRQSLDPPVRPVCPEAPVWPCGAARPCKQPPSLTLCHMPPPSLHKAHMRACILTHLCQMPVEPLAPASTHGVSKLSFSMQALCHVNRHLSGSPESRLTCETRLPRSPGLACGAARPCRQSQCLTLCQMPVLLNAKP